MFNNNSGSDFSKVGLFLTSAAVGIVVTIISMCAFAAVILFAGLDRGYSVPFATVSLSLGSFTAAYLISRKSEKKGYLTGTFVGIVSFAAVTVISFIVSKNGLTVNTLFHFIIIVLASAIGGILGVNKGKNKKYI